MTEPMHWMKSKVVSTARQPRTAQRLPCINMSLVTTPQITSFAQTDQSYDWKLSPKQQIIHVPLRLPHLG